MSDVVRFTQTPEIQELIGHEAITDPAPMTHHHVPLEVDSERVDDGHQIIHLGVTDVDNPQALIIMPTAWSDYALRPFQSLRAGSVSAFANARVATLDFPGMGDWPGGRGNELTEKQIEELNAGRAHLVAQQYWQAIEKLGLPYDAEGQRLPVAIFGNSLGTLTGAELAATAPDDTVIQDLYLNESMGLRQMSGLLLGMKFGLFGGKFLKEYHAMNTGATTQGHRSMVDVGLQALTQRQSHRLSVRALAQGQQSAIVTEAYQSGRLRPGSDGTLVHHVTAEKGLVRPREADRFSAELNTLGAQPNRLVLPGEGHGNLDALPVVLHQVGGLAIVASQR